MRVFFSEVLEQIDVQKLKQQSYSAISISIYNSFIIISHNNLNTNSLYSGKKYIHYNNYRQSQ
jgi:hypothetical protein